MFFADDRFLIKQMSRYEMDAFLRFAPAYFQYMSEAFFHEVNRRIHALKSLISVFD